ncbi:TetR/AcrR family transcriptional regulator [Weissella muntiaci]|uniref:TetR/AcrR family transcriptional regulator n=1 Tax=Weissella muntiaci TaxID=2508881 RepID=A0A6C2C4H9_9LACO|nr:TetR/AcrR family transcriptional regulator C-terminal ligand-binding domain-containing protein [Weissella muntiaci]TYC48734.1 TetR/AcrR family transcriptional regulator [Weissella muntiaci]
MANTRRRGEELEAAIFEATMEILNTDGLEKLSFQRVAEVAGTSKSVIYRRWSQQFDLILDAWRYGVHQKFGKFRDIVLSGDSLREDLLQMLTRFNLIGEQMGAPVLRAMLIEFSEGDRLRNDINELALTIDVATVDHALARAKERGEQVREQISDMAKTIMFSYVRYNMTLMKNKMTDAEMSVFVDEVLLPIFLKNI